MTLERDSFRLHLDALTNAGSGIEAQKKAVQFLRQYTISPLELNGFLERIEDRRQEPAIRRILIQFLGFHRPWGRLDLLRYDIIQDIPRRLIDMALAEDEDRSVREAVIPAVGWQLLSERTAWDALLRDADPFLRRETFFELMRHPRKEGIEYLIHALIDEKEPLVRQPVLYGAARHPLFYDAALTLLSRSGGSFFMNIVAEACATDTLQAARTLLAADVRYVEIRDALIGRLFDSLDSRRIASLLTLMREDRHPFAGRTLREADEAAAIRIMERLDETVRHLKDAEWTDEATKILLHYWDRFENRRNGIKEFLYAWQERSPRVTRMAMDRGIYW